MNIQNVVWASEPKRGIYKVTENVRRLTTYKLEPAQKYIYKIAHLKNIQFFDIKNVEEFFNVQDYKNKNKKLLG